jgi:hypothetical protein
MTPINTALAATAAAFIVAVGATAGVKPAAAQTAIGIDPDTKTVTIGGFTPVTILRNPDPCG